MSQVSYGTITITDTNDIERIYTVYAKSADNATVPSAAKEDWSENVLTAPGTGNYIWQRTVVEKSGTGDKTYSSPVCLTGEEGEPAKNIIAIEVQYGISANWNTQPSSWSENTPNYDSSKPNYWTRTRLKYEGNTYSSWVVNKDYALTEAIYNSVVANSIAQHANEDAQGAMSQAASAVKEVKRIWFTKATSDPPEDPPETGVTTGSASTYNSWSTVKPAENPSYPYYFYCDQTCTNGGVYSHSEILLEADPYTVNALNIRTKNFFHGKDSTYDGWFASGRSTSEGLNESDATTYYYNARFGASHVTLGYNKTPVIDLDGTSGAINIYRLPTINSTTKLVTAAGKLGAKLNASALTFYNTSGTATSTFGDSIALASNGASITIGSTSTGKYNTYIDAQGLYLQTGTTPYATLNANGLVLSKGGIEAGDKNTNNYIYVYSHDDATNHTLAINSSGNKSDWRIIAGNKFGVDKAGNLYASSANISGKITATSGSFTGTIHALNGEFNGTVTASSGTIGRWQITSSALFTNSGSTSAGMGAASDYAFWAGNEAPASAPFRVNYNGELIATKATITGSVLATSFEARGYSGSTLKRRVIVNADGLSIVDETSTYLAKIYGTIAQIGKSNDCHIEITPSTGISLFSPAGYKALEIKNNQINFSDLSGQNVGSIWYENYNQYGKNLNIGSSISSVYYSGISTLLSPGGRSVGIGNLLTTYSQVALTAQYDSTTYGSLNLTDKSFLTRVGSGEWISFDGTNGFRSTMPYYLLNMDNGNSYKILKIEEIEISNITVPADDYVATSGGISRTGYTAVGIIGHDMVGSYGGYCTIYDCYINSNTLYIGIRNRNTSHSFSGSIKFTILYIATIQGTS